MIGSFAGIRFETSDSRILTFLGLSRETSARFANHETIGTKPKKEYLGPSSGGITFTIQLDAQYGVSPKATIRKLDSVMSSGSNSNFILGGWNMGRYVLTKKTDAFGIITNRGGVVQANIDITLEEYA